MKNLCDLHTHCVLSNHGYSSLTENISQANMIGLKYYGISDHQPDRFGVGANVHAINALDHVPCKVADTCILKGCEFNILENGNIDLEGMYLSQLDYGIASLHSYAYEGKNDKNTITQCYLKALEYDFITILGHVNIPKYPFDYEKVLRKCQQVHKLLEVNNSKIRNEENRKMMLDILKVAKKLNVVVIVNSDGHIMYEIGKLDLGFDLLKEIEYPKELIVNYNEELFKEYFMKK